MAYVEDYDIIRLDRIIDTIRVSGRRQDTDVGMGAGDANERMRQQPMDPGAQMSADTIGRAGRAVHGDVPAYIAKILNRTSVPAKLHVQGLLSTWSMSASEA